MFRLSATCPVAFVRDFEGNSSVIEVGRFVGGEKSSSDEELYPCSDSDSKYEEREVFWIWERDPRFCSFFSLLRSLPDLVYPSFQFVDIGVVHLEN